MYKNSKKGYSKIGYNKSEYQFDADSCGVISAIHEQSADINQGVEANKGLHAEQGAGDQGMMFGYATDETDNYMPLALDLSHRILIELAEIRREGKEMTYLRPDSKSQVTIEYSDDNQPIRIEAIVVSTQHDEFILPKDSSPSAIKEAEVAMQQQIEKDVKNILIPRVKAQLEERQQQLFGDEKYHVNPDWQICNWRSSW